VAGRIKAVKAVAQIFAETLAEFDAVRAGGALVRMPRRFL